MKSGTIWNVAIAVPLRKTFAYNVPDEMVQAQAGVRVLVSFGRRRLTGYLLEPASIKDNPTFKIKDVISVLDETPVLPKELLQFLKLSASYYMHPIGEVLRSALPPGIDPTEKMGVLRKPKIKEKIIEIVSATKHSEKSLETMRLKAKKRAAVLEQIIAANKISISSLRQIFKDARVHVNRLLKDELIVVEKNKINFALNGFSELPIQKEQPPILNDEQLIAVEQIKRQIDQNSYRGFMLHGITGSGKTEVYFRAIEQAQKQGKGAIVLVPEITLTPQLVKRYHARFGDVLAVLHSGLSQRERFDQWQLLRNGTVNVAIGVRSAVFAPIKNLGIIVVDEEHDSSFKQERGFPYNARDLALLRASRTNAVAILGSATPSLETYYNAKIDKLCKLTLSKRATPRSLPSIELVNLKQHRSGPGGQNSISKPLYDAINQTLQRGEQGILFLNRRGFAPNLLCKECGDVISCNDCAVSMTLHRRPERLTCHYCGARRSVPAKCPKCSSSNIKPMGAGTQKIEETLAELFPDARVARLDRDVAAGKGAESILDKLRNGEVDLLVGTQMVTKGHDFPMVTLVGVLLGDVGLHMPDFRAAEKTFQLLTQVAGRAGRAKLDGHAIIQTYNPQHPSVALAKYHDYITFAQEELNVRQELGYPPFGRLAALRLSDLNEAKVETAARELMAALREAWHNQNKPPVVMLGPVQAPIAFLQNRYRWRILLRAPRQDQIRKLLNEVINKIESPSSGVRIRLDIDPVSML